MSSVIDTLNYFRNSASFAHPNQDILEDAESYLMINSAKTLLRYISDKINNKKPDKITENLTPDNDINNFSDDIPFKNLVELTSTKIGELFNY